MTADDIWRWACHDDKASNKRCMICFLAWILRDDGEVEKAKEEPDQFCRKPDLLSVKLHYGPLPFLGVCVNNP